MKKRQLLLVMIMLFTLVVATQVSLSQGRGNGNKNKNTNTTQNSNGNNGNNGNNGGNADCPAGTTEVAKFNYGSGGYVLEYGGGVTINGNASGGTWSSTSFISHIVVKGGPAHYIAVIVPAAQSGTFTNFGLPLVGNGNTPGISNIKFCAGQQPTPTPGDCLVGGQITPYLSIDFTSPDTFYDEESNRVSYRIVNTSSTNSYPVGVASYQVYEKKEISAGPPPTYEAIIDGQTIFQSNTDVVGPNSSVVVAVNVPGCAFQVDVFCGPVITNLSSSNLYGNRKLSGQGFAGAWYGPLGTWPDQLCAR